MNTADSASGRCALALLFLSDKKFWLAMLAAPCVWLIMHWGFAMPLTYAASVPVGVMLTTILAYPILEEIVFRGILQAWLLDFSITQKRWLGISVANLLTSLVFTGLHFFNHSPAWAAMVFVPSLVFGWARDRFTSIVPSIVLHVFYNAGFIFLFT